MKAQAEKFAAGQPEKLRPFFERLYYEGEWNAVLNGARLGLAAMAIGEYATAEKAFDEATLRINAVFADDPNAVNARKYWSEEKIKDFKGDIHERAMAFYYRGLLYLRSGDYQNASASFRAADFQDTLSGAEQYQGDFALMNYLAAWANWCDGNETFAKDLMARVQQVADGGGKPAFFAQVQGAPEMPNYLVISESGRAPQKTGTGQHKELLQYRSRGEEAQPPMFVLADPAGYRRLASGLGADVEYQATTRGGRQMDAVLGEKAQFKDSMQTASSVAGVGALATANAAAATGNRDMAGAAGIFALISIGTQIAASTTTPAADLREWNTLPRYVSLDAGVAPAEAFTPMVKVGDAAPVAPLMSGTKGKCGFSWTMHGALPLPAESGGHLTLLNPRLMEEGREAKNKEFRSLLYDRFGSGEKPQ